MINLTRIGYKPRRERVSLESVGGFLYALVSSRASNRGKYSRHVYHVDPTNGQSAKIVSDIKPRHVELWMMERILVTYDHKIYEYDGHFDDRSYKPVKSFQPLEDCRSSIGPIDPLLPGTSTCHMIILRQKLHKNTRR